MGFLDHSTNNIILDAVLTDTGRQFLARNDGSFSISKFAFGDDEVNYGIIKKYGRTVGKEKIEKNTPVFEGMTVQSQAQKYKLVSISNPNLIKIPKLSLIFDSAAVGGIPTLYTTSTLGKPTQTKINLTQTLLNENAIDVEFRDETFIVDLPNLFVRMVGNFSPNNIDRMQRAKYVIPKSSVTSFGGSILEITVSAKSLTSSTFEVYGYGSAKNTIKTYIRVTGMNSGAVKDIPIEVKRSDS